MATSLGHATLRGVLSGIRTPNPSASPAAGASAGVSGPWLRVANPRLVAGVVAIVMGAAWSRSIADRVAMKLGGSFGHAVSALNSAATPQAAPDETEDPSDLLAADDGDATDSSDLSAAKGAHGRPAHERKRASHGVFISANTVLSLANSGARPRAVPVLAKNGRPAGLSLRGVNGLGVGMRDGDVLTEVAGQEVRAVGDVVSIVLVMRSKLAPRITGAFWRGGARWTLVVEQPYLADPALPRAVP